MLWRRNIGFSWLLFLGIILCFPWITSTNLKLGNLKGNVFGKAHVYSVVYKIDNTSDTPEFYQLSDGVCVSDLGVWIPPVWKSSPIFLKNTGLFEFGSGLIGSFQTSPTLTKLVFGKKGNEGGLTSPYVMDAQEHHFVLGSMRYMASSSSSIQFGRQTTGPRYLILKHAQEWTSFSCLKQVLPIIPFSQKKGGVSCVAMRACMHVCAFCLPFCENHIPERLFWVFGRKVERSGWWEECVTMAI